MSATISFIYGETTLVLPSPNYPSELHAGRPQIKGGAVGGRVWVSDLGDGTQLGQPKLTWKGLPKTNFDLMYTFIETTVNLSGLPFSFIDWYSNTKTVRYWGGLYEFQESRYRRFAGTLALREEPA